MAKILNHPLAAAAIGVCASAICVTAQAQGFSMSVPREPVASIPPGDDIILYIHGGPGSRLEEAADITPWLLYPFTTKNGRTYTVISFDQPSQGYSQMIDPLQVIAGNMPLPSDSWYPLLAFSEEFIVQFVNKLGLTNHNVYIIGGSTGGALTLRMGHRADAPWLKKIVAWNPASVWTSYKPPFGLNIDPGKDIEWALKGAIVDGETKLTDETPDSRAAYINGVFDQPQKRPELGQYLSPLGVDIQSQPNPEEWYRGTRPSWKSQGDRTNFASDWACKWSYIGAARLEQQEIYHPQGRRWHGRLGGEMLAFSFFNNVYNDAVPNPTALWVGPADTAPDDANHPAYQWITKPTLLVASDDDDWNEGYIAPGDQAKVGLVLGAIAGGTAASPVGAVIGGVAGALAGAGAGLAQDPIYFHWEDRWTQVQLMASKMQRTPGFTLWYPNTGHSIHNERPASFAANIATFLSGNMQIPALLQPFPTPYPSANFPGPDEPCPQNQNQEPAVPPNPLLLDNPAAAKYLMEAGQQGGSFSDTSSPGTYSPRLRAGLRAVAAQQDPLNALAWSAAFFFSGGVPLNPYYAASPPAGDPVGGKAYADLAVSGRAAYFAFQHATPTADAVAAAASKLIGWVSCPQISTSSSCATAAAAFQSCYRKCFKCWGGGTAAGTAGKGPALTGSPPNPAQQPLQSQSMCNGDACAATCAKSNPGVLVSPLGSPALTNAVQSALSRAYQVAWALRRHDFPPSYALRQQLGWIAVSAEDDPPARPVNVPSGIPWPGAGQGQVASYPQYDAVIPMCPWTLNAYGYPTLGYSNTNCSQPIQITVRYTVASQNWAPPTQVVTGPTAAATTASTAVIAGPATGMISAAQPPLTANVPVTTASHTTAQATAAAAAAAGPVTPPLTVSPTATLASPATPPINPAAVAAGPAVVPITASPGGAIASAATPPPAVSPVPTVSPPPSVTSPAPAPVSPVVATTALAASPPVAYASPAPAMKPPVQVLPPVALAAPPALLASVCLTNDGRTCLPANAAMPAVGQVRHAFVTVSSGGRAVQGAAVTVAGQVSAATTNSLGVAEVNYQGCSALVRPSAVAAPTAVYAPCAGAVGIAGYPSIGIRLP
jgi:hypothetical protein